MVIGLVITLEARPVFGYLAARTFGTPMDGTDMWLGFGSAAVICIVATVIPLRMARRRLEGLEL